MTVLVNWLVISVLALVVTLSTAIIQPELDNSQPFIVNNVPTVFSESNESQWIKIGKSIVMTDKQVIIIKWWGHGGSMYIGQDFEKYIESAMRQGKTVIFELIGMSQSMHAMVPCVGSRVLMTTYGGLMYHLAFNPDTGHVDTSKASKYEMYQFMSRCKPHGLVNDTDIQNVMNRNEVWIYSDGTRSVQPDMRP